MKKEQIRYYYVTDHARVGNKLTVVSFLLTPRKDGGGKAEGMLPFFHYATILDSYRIKELSLSPEGAVEKYKADCRRRVLSRERQLVEAKELLEEANTNDYPVREWGANS
jgi:hypothetical protein